MRRRSTCPVWSSSGPVKDLPSSRCRENYHIFQHRLSEFVPTRNRYRFRTFLTLWVSNDECIDATTRTIRLSYDTNGRSILACRRVHDFCGSSISTRFRSNPDHSSLNRTSSSRPGSNRRRGETQWVPFQ